MDKKKELSFIEGPVFAALIRFALPVLGALILQAAYGAVDLMVVGQFGDASSISAVGTTIILFAVIGIALTILLEIFAGGLMTLLQVPQASYDKAVTYVRICSGGILIIIAYNVISGVLRGVGNANLPFIFVGIACVVNIIGDLLFVGAFHMDAAGAALATVLAQLVSVIASLFVLRRQSLPVSFSLQQCRIYGN